MADEAEHRYGFLRPDVELWRPVAPGRVLRSVEGDLSLSERRGSRAGRDALGGKIQNWNERTVEKASRLSSMRIRITARPALLRGSKSWWRTSRLRLPS